MTEKTFTKSEKFAYLLFNSIVPDTIKQKILSALPELNQSQILRLYRILKTEESRREQMIIKLEIEAEKMRS